MPDKWERGLASHSLLSCHAKVHPGECSALLLKIANLDKEAYPENPNSFPSPHLVLHALPKMYSLSLGELSTRAVQGSAVDLSSLVLSTAPRSHWLLKIDTVGKMMSLPYSTLKFVCSRTTAERVPLLLYLLTEL